MNDPEAATESSNSDTTTLNLEDRVRLSFEEMGYPQLNAVNCTAEGDRMLLTGVLKSFYLKQVAQSVAVKIPGVREVRNEIDVR